MVRGIIIAMACVMMIPILVTFEKKVEPHGQSPWHPLHAPVGRHLPSNVGTGRPKAVPARRSALRYAGVAFCCRGKVTDHRQIL